MKNLEQNTQGNQEYIHYESIHVKFKNRQKLNSMWSNSEKLL